LFTNISKNTLCFLALSILMLTGVHANAQKTTFRVYLIGDAGKISPTQKQLKESLTQNFDPNIPSAFVFLGDNIYEKGMPPMNDKERKHSEQILLNQIDLIKSSNANVFFVPGNHDWKKGRMHGVERLLFQQQYIDSLHLSNIQLQPRDGCPGPVEMPLNERATLVIIDSQWFLHPWEKPIGDDSPCECKTPEDVYLKLNDILGLNENKQVIVAAHHPLYTYGEHAGTLTLKKHIFPMRDLNPNLWIPMPVVGSIYPFYRKLFGNIQDISHPTSRAFREAMQTTLKESPGTIYASGHEHALEYSEVEGVHHVVSGTGAKNSFARKRGEAEFVSSETGFATVDILDNGTSIINFFATGKSESVFKVESQFFKESPLADTLKTVAGGHVMVRASNQYGASGFKKWLLGDNYRKEWNQLLQVPVFDFQESKLIPYQKGGGMQTLSLRLKDANENEFTFRSIEKFPEKAVPEIFKGTFGADLVQDQISAAHPYGALVIPSLAEAAGIYHTNPKLVYVPPAAELGKYKKEFANTLALFEERPDGNESEKPSFGSATKIYSTDKVIEKLFADNDNRVDQSFVVRSRLFDLVIGDWDRHDDQWRWAVFKDKKGELYRPIPRDRDQAFFVSEGVLAKLWSRKWALPKFEGFNHDVRWTPGFMFNARYFDRTFLNALEFDAWEKQADYLKEHLTDDVIESSIQKFPNEIFDLHGKEIISKIKSRRNKLSEYAREHYEFLSKEVDIPGSNRHEQFHVNQQSNGDIVLEVNKLSKKGEVMEQIYSRTFRANETKELRLFGQDGNDRFNFSGVGKNKIKIRVIGGAGEDSLVNTSSSSILVYDDRQGIEMSGRKLRDRTASNPSVNTYDRKSFRYPRLAPLIFGNFNYDDGWFIGGGFHFTNYGFRKDPFKSRHIFLASYAPLTSSYNFKYTASFKNVFGKWGIETQADIKAPNFVNNFFGWGNETTFDSEIDEDPAYDLERSIDYYRIRQQEINVTVGLTRPLGETGELSIGPIFQRVEIEEPVNTQRYIYEYANSVSTSLLENPNSFAGAFATLNISQVDNKLLPHRGIAYQHKSVLMNGLDPDAGNFSSHETSLSLYQSFRIPSRITYALRVGGGLNTGNFELYQAQILDGRTELRGYRKTRFYGDKKLYVNSEIRIKLTTFRSYLFPATLGINGFFDTGRVWYVDENDVDPSAADGSSSLWHKGFGGGIWFTPFNFAVVNSEFAHSDDGNMFYVRLGFLF
jgi:predicted phosphodiesterase